MPLFTVTQVCRLPTVPRYLGALALSVVISKHTVVLTELPPPPACQ